MGKDQVILKMDQSPDAKTQIFSEVSEYELATHTRKQKLEVKRAPKVMHIVTKMILERERTFWRW